MRPIALTALCIALAGPAIGQNDDLASFERQRRELRRQYVEAAARGDVAAKERIVEALGRLAYESDEPGPKAGQRTPSPASEPRRGEAGPALGADVSKRPAGSADGRVPLVASLVSTSSAQGRSSVLPPAMEASAILTATTYMNQLATRHGRRFDFATFRKALQLGELMSRLLSLQDAATRRNVDAHLSWLRRSDVPMSGHFSGQSIGGKSPQEWYRRIGGLSGLTSDEKARLRTMVYCVFTLEGLRRAIATEALARQQRNHGVTARYNIVTTRISFLRALTDELAARSPRNLAFRETDHGAELLRRTGGRPTTANLPRTIEPAGARSERISLAQFQRTPRSVWGIIKNTESGLDAARRRAGKMDADSLRHTIRSARSVVGDALWRRVLAGSGLTEADVK